MPRIRYRVYRPREEAQGIIATANEILEEYAEDGFNLTLRQLYYQFVARDLFPDSYINEEGTKNNIKSYNRLGDIISNAREGGMIDWNHITDRGREVETNPHWRTPRQFMMSVAPQFAIDMWTGQPQRVEVWVEKDALSEVIERACEPMDVPFMACKGYMSSSAIWQAAHDRMLNNWNRHRQPTIVLHLGDHDPSGIDMTRDIQERLDLFSSQYEEGRDEPCEITVERIALTMDQVQHYNPPPNPAKETDSRFAQYQAEHGDLSWELDALEPQVIVALITDAIRDHMDQDLYDARRANEEEWRSQLEEVAGRWDEVADLIGSDDGEEEDDEDDEDDD